ncbi:LytR/AlgR family response regulator transcription factor [Panacibacter ginsenosidivorans]|uniref:LytR/AlgR family response regulator transcription factor n=1 Tax=Panacibacter ginsenosidivorans TaxID=1813871 RepID=UPI0013159A85|nr:LytTR family DNA-binding domain-containing protein [Panacibacter ginsenosidivorans]
MASRNHATCRILIKRGSEHIVLKVEDIVLFYTENKVVYLLDRSLCKYMCERNLSELEGTLSPEMFFRANRKYILNINFVKSYKAFEKVKLVIEFLLPGIEHQVIISQETAPYFKKWISDF